MEHSEDLHPAVRGLKTVCRCNNIKYRTIERAIREGAKSISQIAARTTATMGQCGGSCTPEVQQMLDEHCGGTCPPPPSSSIAGGDAWWVRKK